MYIEESAFLLFPPPFMQECNNLQQKKILRSTLSTPYFFPSQVHVRTPEFCDLISTYQLVPSDQ